ncbi:MAG: hypothetical protein JWO36_8 [Myxococcales bacterium]|nr:hypothetical protein [Myxococcales bacterium]
MTTTTKTASAKRPIRLWSATILIALLGMLASVPTASAQPAAALGKPLPSADLPVGEVSIRIIAGSPASPVNGTEVTLVVNGAPHLARTDTAGRAVFKDLPSAATVQAKVTDEDKKEITSETFVIPSDSGVRVMLSTRPMTGGGGGGAPFANGGGMPEPRQLSGEPRPEQSDAPGSYTVRVVYDDFKDPLENVPVTLVGYHADLKVTIETKQTDKEGRAQFTGLDRSGSTSYFAMTQVPRNGAIDRLIAKPVVLDPQLGVRLVLSSEKRNSTAPPLDELVRLDPQESGAPAGKVMVTLTGVPAPGSEIALVDAATGAVIAKAAPHQAAADPTDVNAQSQFEPKADVPAGTVDVQVHGGTLGTNVALKDVAIKIVPSDSTDPLAAGLVESKTPESGTVRLAVPASRGQLVAVFTINGKRLSSQPFDLSKSGGVLDVEAHWDSQGKAEVVYDIAPKPGQVLYVESEMRQQPYRTEPFQMVDGRGAHITLFVYPRILFSFSLTSHIDDSFLAVSGRFDVENNSWIPYVAGPDGMVLPLPKHFKGAIVAERDQADVSVAQGEGYRIVRPIPPGTKRFQGAFSLPIESGQVDWALDLPYGAFQSGMEILQVPGMSVNLPANVTGRTVTVPQGTYFLLEQIQILPRQSMTMTITNLPAAAAWHVWLPRLVGIVVIVLILGGLGFALFGRATSVADFARAAKRAALLDELVKLEKIGKTDNPEALGAQREAVIAELEKHWD